MGFSNLYDRYGRNDWGRSNKSKKVPAEKSGTSVARINVVQDQLAEALNINLLPSLSTTQLEQIKSLEQIARSQGGYIEFPPLDIDFLASIIIPVGYKLCDDTSIYELLLSADEHTLRIVPEEEYKEADIHLQDRQGNPIILKDRVKVIKVSLIGTIFYNLLITGFEAKTLMYGKNETVFSSDPAIPINVVLGYANYEYNELEHPLNQYVITVTKGEESLMTAQGERISRNSPLFFPMLQAGSENITIEGPYTLTIEALPPPIC